jgi:hypothetical protein
VYESSRSHPAARSTSIAWRPSHRCRIRRRRMLASMPSRVCIEPEPRCLLFRMHGALWPEYCYVIRPLSLMFETFFHPLRSLNGGPMKLPVIDVEPRRFKNSEVHPREAIIPQGCDWVKKLRCAASVAACVAACAGGPAACVACFASVGASDCMDCL